MENSYQKHLVGALLGGTLMGAFGASAVALKTADKNQVVEVSARDINKDERPDLLMKKKNGDYLVYLQGESGMYFPLGTFKTKESLENIFPNYILDSTNTRRGTQ